MSEPLTLVEAVPLGTVHLQRLLTAAGIRSLVIKGPAFVELGVRKPRQSNDIDLLVAPRDCTYAAQALNSGGWSSLSPWYPRALDDVTYSGTFSHTHFPVTVDLHHHFAGLLADDAFEVLWDGRSTVKLARCQVLVPGQVDAFVIEALNALKSRRPEQWGSVAKRVIDHSGPVDVDTVIRCAVSLGARETAGPVIEALCGPSFVGPPSPGYLRWVRESGQERPRILLTYLARRAPWAFPRVVWDRLTPKGLRAASGVWTREGGIAAYVRLLVRRLRGVLTR